MPESLKPGEVNSQTDPSVAKQYDTETSKVKQVEEFYKLVDGKKVSMLNTYRNGVGKFSHSNLSIPQYVSPPTHIPFTMLFTLTKCYFPGPVGRSMAVAKRNGPDFLYLANAHSKKCTDLQQNKEVQISFQDTKTQDWISWFCIDVVTSMNITLIT